MTMTRHLVLLANLCLDIGLMNWNLEAKWGAEREFEESKLPVGFGTPWPL